MLAQVSVIAIAFALGSIPTAYLLGRLISRRDIRALGSGNPGALNAAQQLGKPAGAVVLLVDAGKGILAVVIAQWMSVSDLWVYGTALFATLGHNFSPILGFKGGKGAATVLGMSAFMLWEITAISGACGVLVLLAVRHPVLAMGVVFVVLNILTIATGQPLGQIILCLILSFLVAGTHIWRQYAEIVTVVRNRNWRGFGRIN